MAKGKMGFEKGNYGSAKGVRAKAVNLSDAQLKRAGALKASKKPVIDYTRTTRAEGVTRGPKGKPLTGKVTLPSGKTAVYKAGKRVINVKPSSGDGDASGGTTGRTDAQRAAAKAATNKKVILAKRGMGGSNAGSSTSRPAGSINSRIEQKANELMARAGKTPAQVRAAVTTSSNGTTGPARSYPSMNVGRGASASPVGGTRGKIIAVQNKISAFKATAKQNQENAKTAAAKAAAAAKDNATLRALQQQLATLNR
jgi:hypothetical protein